MAVRSWTWLTKKALGCCALISIMMFPLDKMAAILHTTISNSFAWTEFAVCYFDLNYSEVCTLGSNWLYVKISEKTGSKFYIFLYHLVVEGGGGGCCGGIGGGGGGLNTIFFPGSWKRGSKPHSLPFNFTVGVPHLPTLGDVVVIQKCNLVTHFTD